MSANHTHITFSQYSIDSVESVKTNVAIEAPVSLTVNGKVWLTFQCTPDYLEQMAVGFLFNEGFVTKMDEIASIYVCEKRDNVDIWLNHAAEKPDSWRRTSGCHGGSTSTDLEKDKIEPILDPAFLSVTELLNLISSFQENQPPHSESGGVHTSAIADGENIIFYQEDIGRHNTFDKIAGRILMDNIDAKVPIVLTTGRVSSDMMQKAIRLRVPYIISMRSTSSISVNLANDWGITLICSARKTKFNVFAHPERILIV